MHLVDGQRGIGSMDGRPLGHPVHVFPGKPLQVPDFRGCRGSHLGREADRVRLGQSLGLLPDRSLPAGSAGPSPDLTPLTFPGGRFHGRSLRGRIGVRQDLVLVQSSRLHARHEELPYSGLAAPPHGVHPGIPAVELAHEPHARGARSPDGKARARHALVHQRAGTQELVDSGQARIRELIQDLLRGHGSEPVRVVHDLRVASRPGQLEPVVRKRPVFKTSAHVLWQDHLEYPLAIAQGHLETRLAGQQGHRFGMRAERPHHASGPARTGTLHTEHSEGLFAATGHDGAQLAVTLCPHLSLRSTGAPGSADRVKTDATRC